jgi:hypothetical protein
MEAAGQGLEPPEQCTCRMHAFVRTLLLKKNCPATGSMLHACVHGQGGLHELRSSYTHSQTVLGVEGRATGRHGHGATGLSFNATGKGIHTCATGDLAIMQPHVPGRHVHMTHG